MRVRLTEIRLRPTGKKARLDRDVEVESLFIGRGPDNDLSLKGLTISLHQATIRSSEGRIYIEAAAGLDVNVNGFVTSGERLGIGDKVRIGAWELRILEPETNMDLAVEYEEIDRADNARSALDARTKLGVEAGYFARRPLSWAAVGLVLGAFVLVPLVWGPAQLPWATGRVSRGHAYIENECQSCHTGAFKSVQNAECVTCHYDVGRHAAPEVEVAALENVVCADCHLEHRGREAALADGGSEFCSDCHAQISNIMSGSDLQPVSDFATDHPPFKLAVVTDPTLAPVPIRITPDVEEDSGLRFDHFAHAGTLVTDLDDVDQFLNCGACHRPDARGLGMQPIVFEDHCQNCHALDFEPLDRDVIVPHGDSGAIRSFIREFYWDLILSGNLDDEDDSVPALLRRRRPGTALTPDESALSRRWVEAKLVDAEDGFYGRSGTCRDCHRLEAGAASDGGMSVQKVRIQTRWSPNIAFSHDSHSPFACARCHPAAAVLDPDADMPRPDWSATGSIPYELLPYDDPANASEVSSDILIPSIETCQECHSGPGASGRGVVPSPCSMCHPFHSRELEKMH